MKKLILSLAVIICWFQLSCETAQIKNALLEGDLSAKNILTVLYDFPQEIAEREINWYIAETPEGEWKKLPGIWSQEIVLLTSYVDKYIKCEISYLLGESDKKITTSIISSEPIKFKILRKTYLSYLNKSIGDDSIGLSSHGSTKTLATHYIDSEVIAKGLSIKMF